MAPGVSDWWCADPRRQSAEPGPPVETPRPVPARTCPPIEIRRGRPMRGETFPVPKSDDLAPDRPLARSPRCPPPRPPQEVPQRALSGVPTGQSGERSRLGASMFPLGNATPSSAPHDPSRISSPLPEPGRSIAPERAVRTTFGLQRANAHLYPSSPVQAARPLLLTPGSNAQSLSADPADRT